MISFITLIVGIVDDGLRGYQVHNTGGWYDFGFLLGVNAVWGGKAGWDRSARRRRRPAAVDPSASPSA